MTIGQSGFLSENELFNSLANSAFEFLEKAIEEFAESSKFSTVHFAIAIELILKAKLMREHWSLLLEKPDLADKNLFFSGDIKTVSTEQTIQRLQKIASVSISKDAQDVFSKIVKHRNKMVHFAHISEKNKAKSNELEKIAEEQCTGWFHIKSLLENWADFSGFKKRIQSVSKKMEGHKTYLRQVFNSKKEELKQHMSLGLKVIKCPICNFAAAKVQSPVGAIADVSCVVCRYVGSDIVVTCANVDCNQSIHFTDFAGAPESCYSCHAELSKDHIKNDLDTRDPVTKDNYFDHVEINCPECGCYHNVVQHHHKYLCVVCFASDDSYEVCGNCSEGQLGGVPEHSSLVGCDFCEGSYRHD